MAHKIKEERISGGMLVIVDSVFFSRVYAPDLWYDRGDGFYQSAVHHHTVDPLLNKYGTKRVPSAKEGCFDVLDIETNEVRGIIYPFSDWEQVRPPETKKSRKRVK